MKRTNEDRTSKGKKNPLTNKTAMNRLNPASKTLRAAEEKALAARKVARAAALKAKRSKVGRKDKAARTVRQIALNQGLEQSFQAAHQKVLDEFKAGLYKAAGEAEEEEGEQ